MNTLAVSLRTVARRAPGTERADGNDRLSNLRSTRWGIDHVKTNVVFKDFGHQRIECPARSGESLQDEAAVALRLEKLFDSIELAANALDAIEQLHALTNSVGRDFLPVRPGGYATILR